MKGAIPTWLLIVIIAGLLTFVLSLAYYDNIKETLAKWAPQRFEALGITLLRPWRNIKASLSKFSLSSKKGVLNTTTTLIMAVIMIAVGVFLLLLILGELFSNTPSAINSLAYGFFDAIFG